MFQVVRGESLDLLVEMMGFERRRWLWVFREPDWLLRRRVNAERKRRLYGATPYWMGGPKS